MSKQGTRHIIQRPIFEVEFPATENQWAFQDTLQRIFMERFLPVIERVCDRVSPNGAVHYLERLEIDLGRLDFGDFSALAAREFEGQFAKALTAALERERGATPPSGMAEAYGLSPTASAGEREAPQRDAEARAKAAAAPGSVWQILRHFMATGLLPWWAESEDRQILAEAMAQALAQQPEQLKDLAVRWWQAPDMRYRLFAQFPDALLAALAALYFPVPRRAVLSAALQAALAGLPGMAARQAPPQALGQLRLTFWTEVFYCLMPPAVEMDILQAVLEKFSKDSPDEARRRGKKQPPDNERSKQDRPPAKQQSGPKEAGKAAADGTGETLPGRNAPAGSGRGKDAPGAAPDLSAGATPRTRQAEIPRPARRLEPDEEVYVSNAGLVILWPFLQRFFQEQQLVEDKAFVDEAARHRAVYLLQALAEGPADFPEFLLPLNKVLCGLPPTAPLAPPPEAPDTAYQACEPFLERVIATAPILNNMSVAGFRGTFLAREGILREQPQQWLLQVERETYDIVLDRFPWPRNFVKLPWMEKIMVVEW